MKIQLVTVGKPKLTYAQAGWNEYLTRLQRQHNITVTQLADKYAGDTKKLLEATINTYRVGLVITGQQYSSTELADKLKQWQSPGKPVSFIVGGPDGLPANFMRQLKERWSFGKLTLPHDLAMVTLLEAIYRATMIQNNHPYHH